MLKKKPGARKSKNQGAAQSVALNKVSEPLWEDSIKTAAAENLSTVDKKLLVDFKYTTENEDFSIQFAIKDPVAKKFFLSAEKIAVYKFHFDRYDRDKSGDISIGELFPFLEQVGLAPRNRAEQCKLSTKIEELDNGDGVLTFSEFVHLLKSFERDAVQEIAEQLDIALQVTEFPREEVGEYWKLFAQFSGEEGFLTVANVRQILVQFGTRLSKDQTLQLDTLMRPLMVNDMGSICAVEFPAFLVLIKEMASMDFCGCVKRATELCKDHRSEADRINFLHQKILRDAEKKAKQKKRILEMEANRPPSPKKKVTNAQGEDREVSDSDGDLKYFIDNAYDDAELEQDEQYDQKFNEMFGEGILGKGSLNHSRSEFILNSASFKNAALKMKSAVRLSSQTVSY